MPLRFACPCGSPALAVRLPLRFALTHGFSLVELLVVLAVLTLLFTILIPNLWLTRQTASATECSANLRNVGIFVHSFSSSNGDLVAPAVRERDFTWNEPLPQGWDVSAGRLAGEIGGIGSVWRCKANDAPYLGNARALGLDTSFVKPSGPIYRVGPRWWYQPSKLAFAYDIQVNLFDPPMPFVHARSPLVGDVSDEMVRGWDRDSDEPTMALSLEQFGPHRDAFGVLFADGHAAVNRFRDEAEGILWSGRRWWP